MIVLLTLQWALSTTTVFAQTASARPSRVVAYGEVGFANLGADDSEQGNAVIYGGELTARLLGALHAGIDVNTGSIKPTHFGSDFRQISILISALGEWPRDARVRGLAGGGIGWLSQQMEGVPRFTVGVFHGRGGVVGDIGKHLRGRAEAILTVGEGVSWIVGGRAAIGYSF